MHRKWVTNIDRAQARELRERMESDSGNVYLIGRPSANGPWSVAELEVMNLVGIYMEVPDSEIKPDPDCPDCKGTGVVTLFTSSSPCRCLSRFEKDDDDVDNNIEYNDYWE